MPKKELRDIAPQAKDPKIRTVPWGALKESLVEVEPERP